MIYSIKRYENNFLKFDRKLIKLLNNLKNNQTKFNYQSINPLY